MRCSEHEKHSNKYGDRIGDGGGRRRSNGDRARAVARRHRWWMSRQLRRPDRVANAKGAPRIAPDLGAPFGTQRYALARSRGAWPRPFLTHRHPRRSEVPHAL